MTMNKVLISAAFALSLIASGNAFAAPDIDESIYAETPSAVSGNVAGFMPSADPISAETAALYNETTSSVVASIQTANGNEQLADSGVRSVVLPE
jgi:hypothetical protein